MRYLNIILLVLICLPSSSGILRAKTIRVPDDQVFIQAAIWVALDGDTVLVADGTYSGDGNKDISFGGKAIMVMSENGPDVTVIDCEHSGRGFQFNNGEGSSSRLMGFTIQHGYTSGGGGGIHCNNASSPCIMKCNIINKECGGGGGGIHLHDAGTKPDIYGCLISGNRASGGDGGGMYTGIVDARLANCIISSNTTSSRGGGICSADSDLEIQYCTFAFNEAQAEGDQLACIYYSTNVLSNCILWGEGSDIIHEKNSNLTVTFSDVKDGWTGVGNISADPLFFDPYASDFHLTIDSPCIDTGTDIGIYEDFDGDQRPWGDGYDMGADEFACSGLVLDVLYSPPWIRPGYQLNWKIRAVNYNDEPLEIDTIRLDVEGSFSYTKLLWSGYGKMYAGYAGETWFEVFVPFFVPLGSYLCTTIASFEGEDLAEVSFDGDVIN